MNLISWIPSIATTSLLATAVWLARNAISTRLTRSVQHEFDRKIESVRSELRVSEELIKAQLREKEAEISALRGGALSALANRQAALDKRRLEAVDQLWTAFNSLSPARSLAATMSVVNFDEAAKVAERDPKTRQFFETIGAGFDQTKIDHSSANKARPFVSPMAWAVYVAYSAITMHSVMRWHVLKGGLGAKDFTDRNAIEKLVVAVLPHYKDHLEKNGPDAYYYLLDELEQKSLAEIQAMLISSEFDMASVEQAAEITRQAKALQAATDEAQRKA